ncbi:MAG: cusB 1 [Akkermansiaceae bacterium]|nr:cusB 1 [Akkermansiaceae bacterium]
MKTFLIVLLSVAIAATATWFLKPAGPPASATTAQSSEKKVLFYQSPMHPWIKSDKPGRCTICGMELVPVYQGDKGFDATGGENTVALTQNQVQVLHVETAEAKVQPLARTLQVAGMIDDDATRHRYISAYIDGRVDKLHVNYLGAEVTEGQPLADFYSPALLQAEREYRQLSGDLKNAAALRLRQMGLTPGQIADAASKPAEVLNSPILAPLTGTVVAQSVYEGQYVTAGEKLFEIADFSTMWFMFQAYEMDLSWIHTGQKVTITLPALPGRTFEGKVTFIDPNFDETTRSTKVRVELPNPVVNGHRELLHKLYADGQVEITLPDALAIPRSAVIETGPEAVVYVDRQSGAYERTPVKLGRRGDALVEVLSGLTKGDRVVTNGNLLIDGQAEMNRSFATAPTKDTGSSPKITVLSKEQQSAIGDFLKLQDAMAEALAADDLAAFNKASEPAMQTTTALTTALAGTSDHLEALDSAKHFHGFKDLTTARVAFYRFTSASSEVLEPLRKLPTAPAFHLWECPMVSDAVPEAGKPGRWFQLGDRPHHNPYFGAEMLDCGDEIQP